MGDHDEESEKKKYAYLSDADTSSLLDLTLTRLGIRVD